MPVRHRDQWTAFASGRGIASGTRAEVARAVKEYMDGRESEAVLVFDDANSELIELDLRGSVEDVVQRYAATCDGDWDGESRPIAGPQRGPGRPKLGVVGREVTLLPRHWAWLNAQRGGASVTLRRLVEQARRETAAADQVREGQDATYRFMLATVGNEPGFEEATRALYSGNADRFHAEAARWPDDLREHASRLAQPVFVAESSS